MCSQRKINEKKFQFLSPTFRGWNAKYKIPEVVFLLFVACMQTSLACPCTCMENYTFVQTQYGEVRGQLSERYVSDQRAERKVAAFLGIPYAKPPVGELRFLKPQPPDPWNTILEADNMPPACVQHSQYPFPWYDSEPGQSEDCLYLNVWAPFNVSNKRAVKLYIHGGGFSSGSNRMGYYGGQDDAIDFYPDSAYKQPQKRKFLGTVDVVINYRLGALGFLTSGTEDAPGNVGLYDMILALHWVRENIAAFGGDPNKIALVGEGAGAIATSLFTISPLTRSLFRRAVMRSGNFLTIRKNKFEDNLKLSQRLATAVGCNSTSLQEEPQKTVQCLRNVSASRLAEELSSFNPTSPYSFYPQYEQDDFMPIDPLLLLEFGPIYINETLISYTSDEGSYLLTTLRPDVFGVFGEKDVPLNGSFAKQILTEYLKKREYPHPETIADRLLNNTDSEATLRNRQLVYNATGDEAVVCPIVYFAEMFAGPSHRRQIPKSVYLSENSVRVPYNPWADWMGSVHFNDVQLQFFHTDGPLRVNGMSYNISESELTQSFYTKLDTTAFISNGELPRAIFSSTRPNYTFLNQTGQLFENEKMSNPSQYNCNIFKPYHKLYEQ